MQFILKQISLICIIVLGVILLNPQDSLSMEVKACRSVLENKAKVKSDIPSVVSETNRHEVLKQAVTDLERYQKDMIHIAINESPVNLKDGAYLYLVDSNKNLYMVSRFLNPFDKQVQKKNPQAREYLALHKYLKMAGSRHLQQVDHINSEIKIVGAGEVVVRFGHILKINNKSGSFRSDLEHLNFAVSLIKTHVSNPFLKKGVLIIDVSDSQNLKKDQGHSTALDAASANFTIVQNNELVILKERLVKAFEYLAVSGSEENFGEFLQQKLDEKRPDHSIDIEVFFTLSFIKGAVLSPNESIAKSLLALESTGKIKQIKQILAIMDEYNHQYKK
jgi:hypothetical protein